MRKIIFSDYVKSLVPDSLSEYTGAVGNLNEAMLIMAKAGDLMVKNRPSDYNLDMAFDFVDSVCYCIGFSSKNRIQEFLLPKHNTETAITDRVEHLLSTCDVVFVLKFSPYSIGEITSVLVEAVKPENETLTEEKQNWRKAIYTVFDPCVWNAALG